MKYCRECRPALSPYGHHLPHQIPVHQNCQLPTVHSGICHNHNIEQQSASVSLGQPTAGQVLNNLAVNGLTGTHNSGHDSGTTHAAVSGGNLIIRDKAHQTQDVANLSRDTDNAANVLSPIFDKEKEQQRLKQSQLIGELSAQMTEIASTEGKIIATKAAKAKLDHISEPDKAAAREKLINAGNKDPSPADINKNL